MEKHSKIFESNTKIKKQAAITVLIIADSARELR